MRAERASQPLSETAGLPTRRCSQCVHARVSRRGRREGSSACCGSGCDGVVRARRMMQTVDVDASERRVGRSRGARFARSARSSVRACVRQVVVSVSAGDGEGMRRLRWRAEAVHAHCEYFPVSMELTSLKERRWKYCRQMQGSNASAPFLKVSESRSSKKEKNSHRFFTL